MLLNHRFQYHLRNHLLKHKLKQDLHVSVARENLSVLVYALTNGFLDDIEIDDLKAFEEGLYSYLQYDELGQKVINTITETNDLPDKELLNQVLLAYKQTL